MQACDQKICDIANSLEPKPTRLESSYMKWKIFKKNSKRRSLLKLPMTTMYQFFAPHLQITQPVWFSNASRTKSKITFLELSREFRELTEIKLRSKQSGL